MSTSLSLGQLTTAELAELHLTAGDWASRLYLAALTVAHQAAARETGSDEYRRLQAARGSAMACAREVEDITGDTRDELAARRDARKETSRD